jgi:hypothetical protein
MKSWQDLAVAAILLLVVFKAASCVPGESHTNTTAKNLQQTFSNGVTVPSMSNGYPCDLGELGKHDSCENNKHFWGDDGISQGFKGTGDAVGRSFGRLGVSF